MNSWSDPSALTNISGFQSNILNFSDPLLNQIITSKKALQLLESNLITSSNDDSEGEESKDKSIIELLLSSCDGDVVTLESILKSNPELVNKLYPTNEAGVTPLVYAICFNNDDIVSSLLEGHDADPDVADTIINYTPLMWAVYLNQLDTIKLLLNYQADPYFSPKDDGKNAITLLNPEKQEIIDYFKSHNVLKNASNNGEEQDIFTTNTFIPNEIEDDLTNKFKMQTLSGQIDEDEVEHVYENDDEYILAQDPVIPRLPDFEYEKLLPEQYIKFTDSDIPSLIDYIFNLRSNTNYQHNARLPAAIVFQLIRYAHLKVESKELTDFLFDCFTARLRTVTNTKSGAFNMALQEENAKGAGDIVLLSYWLSSLQYLHFYFIKNKFYTAFPRFLQEIINLAQSLIATLSFSINSRLNLLVNDCILNFTSLIDVSNTLYAKDWNLFKKNKKHPNNFDDILNTLNPPTQDELMKPSPIRYIQVLGALDYVLKIHNVDNLFRVQTFSLVFYYIDCIIFNNIISQSKYCTRSKAIQLRLNLSAIEDWLRSHNLKFQKPEKIGGLSQLVIISLNNLLSDDKSLSKKDPQNLEFYYDSLYHVCKNQLQPTIELLQWLQCMSSLSDEENLIKTINQFDYLNYYQIFKTVNKLYKYEVDEPRLPKKLVNFIKSLMNEQGEQQIHKNFQHYMTQSTYLTKEVYVYLNPNFIFNIALPNSSELINSYGAGIGGVSVLRSKKYQPSLPISVVDDIDELLTENKNAGLNDTYDYEAEEVQEEDDDDDELENNQHELKPKTVKDEKFKGDELFKSVQMPNSLLHRNWGDEEIESNPW
ncbi:uncharacterized protein KGF55_000828 [Candida pseudojiufengensis]|uniref:uncharacterized protein n=1 Tax=Candida pseudojiufengensis TaxID=497109 RepID=UPI00222417AD|nr:uncharacterized protein KGF55_000828 [Candida pseudojiufengensis]KAI5966519.1 hypothetical protein KGF55_000828 [Candida pseudojiufengensis]